MGFVAREEVSAGRERASPSTELEAEGSDTNAWQAKYKA